jgi:hypothetical protein
VTNPPRTTRQTALSSLSRLLQTSQNLDNTLDSALHLIQAKPTEDVQPLRLALHRLTGDVTDHLASATSRLMLLVDKPELKVLGEMYDIPVMGSQMLKSRSGSEGDEHDRPVQETISASVPSPRRGIRPLNLQLDRSPRPSSPQKPHTAHPMSTSHSLPGHLYSAQKQHTYHLSLVPPSADDDDRFTSLPSRKRRMSKRNSWDSELWKTVRESGGSAKRPSHERRITEANEDEEDTSSSSDGHGVKSEGEGLAGPFTPTPQPRSFLLRTPSREGSTSNRLPTSDTLHSLLSPDIPLRHRPTTHIPITPISQNPKRHSFNYIAPPPHAPTSTNPKRHSLQSIPYHPSFSPETGGTMRPRSITLQPSTPMTANQKRRSLQDMPYYPSANDPTLLQDRERDSDLTLGVGSVGLTRTRSMPFSDLQELRSRTSTGSRSRSDRNSISSSIASFGVPVGSSPMMGRFSRGGLPRVPSISPLTVQGLKASCLGVHMKRRRLACCLLGLKWDEGEGYWEDVVDILKGLEEGIASETKGLKGVCEGFKEVEGGGVEDEWERIGREFGGGVEGEFAPRLGDREVLLGRVEDMKKGLEGVWMELEGVYHALSEEAGTDEVVGRRWLGLRERFGGLFRDWERGKDAAKRLAGLDEKRMDSKMDDVPVSRLPDFMKVWVDGDDDTSGSGTSSDRPLSLEVQPADIPEMSLVEVLPPPGRDEVFEGVVPPGFVEGRLKGMSREERIGMMRVARERGMTLSEVLRREEEGQGKKEKDERVRENGMEVLGELKGMIGAIRRKKAGVVEPVETIVPSGVGGGRTGSPVTQGHTADFLNGERSPTIHDRSSEKATSTSKADANGELAMSPASKDDDDNDWRRGFVFPVPSTSPYAPL